MRCYLCKTTTKHSRCLSVPVPAGQAAGGEAFTATVCPMCHDVVRALAIMATTPEEQLRAGCSPGFEAEDWRPGSGL